MFNFINSSSCYAKFDDLTTNSKWQSLAIELNCSMVNIDYHHHQRRLIFNLILRVYLPPIPPKMFLRRRFVHVACSFRSRSPEKRYQKRYRKSTRSWLRGLVLLADRYQAATINTMGDSEWRNEAKRHDVCICHHEGTMYQNHNDLSTVHLKSI
jgi:hypothetical protein